MSASDLVGLPAVSREGAKIGKIRDVISDPQSSSEYLVVSHSLFYDVVVPVGAASRRGDTVRVLVARSDLEVVLRDVLEGTVPRENWHRLVDSYESQAA